MKILKFMIFAIVVIGFSPIKAEACGLNNKRGVWERFCLENKIGDACKRAINSLSDKITTARGSEALEIRNRLRVVAEFGCQLHDKLSCQRLEEAAVRHLATEI